MEEFIIEKVQISLGFTLAPSQMQTMTVHQQEDFIASRLAVQLRMYLTGKTEDTTEVKEATETREEVGETKTFTNSWWDGAKLCLARAIPWLFGRLHIKYVTCETVHRTIVTHRTTTTVRQTRICPHLNVPADHNRAHEKFLLNP